MVAPGSYCSCLLHRLPSGDQTQAAASQETSLQCSWEATVMGRALLPKAPSRLLNVSSQEAGLQLGSEGDSVKLTPPLLQLSSSPMLTFLAFP